MESQTIVFLIIFFLILFVIITIARAKGDSETSEEDKKKQISEDAQLAQLIEEMRKFFINPKTNKFKYHKFNSPPNAIVRIEDETDIREYFEYLEPEEKRNFDLLTFLRDLPDFIFDIEPIEEALEKLRSKDLPNYPFLAGNITDFFELLRDFYDQPNSFLFPDSIFEEKLIKEGVLIPRDLIKEGFSEEEVKQKLIEGASLDELKNIAKELNIKIPRRRADLEKTLYYYEGKEIWNYFTNPYKFNEDKVGEIIADLINIYVNDIKKTVKDWPYFIQEEIYKEMKEELKNSFISKIVSLDINISFK